MGRRAQSPLMVDVANLLVAGAEVEDRVELSAGLNGNAKATQIHRAVNPQFLQAKLLRGNLGHPAGVVVSLLFESLFWESASRKSHTFGFLAANLAARQEGQVFGPMRPDHPVPESTDVTGASRNRREADASVIGDENHIGADAELRSAREAVAMDHRDDRLGQIAQAQPVFDVALQESLIVVDSKWLGAGLSPAAGKIISGREGAASAANDQDLDIGILLDLGDGVGKLGDKRRGHRVEFFGTVQGERAN